MEMKGTEDPARLHPWVGQNEVAERLGRAVSSVWLGHTADWGTVAPFISVLSFHSFSYL